MDLPDDEPLDRMPLHVAATRPAMLYGVPYVVFVPLAVVCVEIDVILGDMMAIVLDPVLSLLTFIAVKHDYNAPRLWYVWAHTKLRALLDSHFHGGAAVSAFPIKPAKRRARGVPSDAW